MMTGGPSNEKGAWRAPRALLDGGGESWSALAQIVWHRIEELATGQVLEVISVEPSVRAEILAWCVQAGHELLQMLDDGDAVRFWIRKGQET